MAASHNEHGYLTQRCANDVLDLKHAKNAKDENGYLSQRCAKIFCKERKGRSLSVLSKEARGQTLKVICNPVYAVFFSLSYFFHDKKVTKNLVLSKAFLGSKPKLKNRLFARNPKPEAASVILVHYSSPIFLNYHTTIASRCCFHTLVLRTLGCGACGALF